MADHVDQGNMNDLMLTANTFSIKEEQCEGDSFIEDEVRISETGDITMDNPELQDVWHNKLMQYDAYKTSDNVRTELASFEVTDIQNDNVKVEEEITPETEFVKVEEEIAAKIEFDNGRLYCEHCKAYYQDYCTDCGMLVHILNKHARKNADTAALDDIPNDILEIRDCFEHTGVYALRIIPAAVKFGPFTGLGGTECPWEMKGEKFILDKNKWKYLNWMQYINPTRNISEGNLQVFQCEDNIYYESTRPIHAYEELLVYFGVEDGNSPNKIGRQDFVTVAKDISNEVFACTFCCLGFSSISHLAKHKTICVQDTGGTFSIEELAQCLFCKVHLELKEYSEHHMAFCFERNARKGIPPTPPAKQERRFKTKEFPRLRVERTHAFVGGKDNQEYSTSDHRNTHIRVKQSSLQYLKNRFKCSLCVFRTKYKHVLRLHTRTKHMKEFDYKCNL